MTKTISSPRMGMAASLGRKPCPPSRVHCFGADRDGKMCGERQTCALHQRQISDPVGSAMRLPRVGGNPCHFMVPVKM